MQHRELKMQWAIVENHSMDNGEIYMSYIIAMFGSKNFAEQFYIDNLQQFEGRRISYEVIPIDSK
jgi:hypothetical protein